MKGAPRRPGRAPVCKTPGMTTDGDLGFAGRVTKDGDVVVLRGGRVVTTLRGAAAADFLTEIKSAEPAAAQQLMARVTGNYKRGNERWASRHPRNRAPRDG